MDTSNKQTPLFDNVLEMLGMPGRYQLTQLSMTFLCILIVTIMTLSFVFLGYSPPHECNMVNETSILQASGLLNSTEVKVEYNACEIRFTATTNKDDNEDVYGNDTYSFKDSIGNNSRPQRKYVLNITTCLNGRNFSGAITEPTTFVSEWDLVCESIGVAEWSQTIFILGQMISGLITSQIADRFGRQPVFVTSTCSVFVLESLVLASPSIYIIYGIKFFSGFFLQAVMTSYLVLGMEILLPRHRQIYGVLICCFWIFQVMVTGGIAYVFRNENWRYLQGCAIATGLVCVVYPFVVQESPRWLIATGNSKRALAVIEKACRQNKKDFGVIQAAFKAMVDNSGSNNDGVKPPTSIPIQTFQNGDAVDGNADVHVVGDSSDHEDINSTVIITTNPVTAQQSSNVTLLFRSKNLSFVTLILMYIWLTCNMTYYGLYMTSSSIAGDRFLNFTLMALVEIPSNLVILIMMNKISRRIVLMTFMALSAISLMASSLFLTFGDASSHGGYAYISTALFIFGKFAIGSAFNIIFIITPEVFPTNLCCVGTGLCSSFSRVGSMVAPFMRPLFNVAPWGPGVIFTSMCTVAFFLIPFLPETKDKAMPNNIEDFKRSQETKRKLIWK